MKLLLTAIINLVRNIRKVQVRKTASTRMRNPGVTAAEKVAGESHLPLPAPRLRLIHAEYGPETAVSSGETFSLTKNHLSFSFFLQNKKCRTEEGKGERRKIGHWLFSPLMISLLDTLLQESSTTYLFN